MYEEKCEAARTAYYTNIVSDLKTSNPGQWYSKLKRMSSYDQLKCEQVNVEDISDFTDIEQAEIIAENFSKISNNYDPIDPSKICLNPENDKSTPTLEAYEVYEYLKKIKTNTSTVKGDIPAKIIKEFAPEISAPLANIIDCMVRRGEFFSYLEIRNGNPCNKSIPPLNSK